MIQTTSAPEPDPAGAADRILSEAERSESDDSGGASEPRPKKDGRGGRRKGSGRKPKSFQEKVAAQQPAVELPITESEITSMAMLIQVCWNIFGVKMAKMTPLDEIEQRSLATVTIPVVRKYAPFLGGWEIEFNFLLILSGLILAHLPPRETESFAEVVDNDGTDQYAP